MATEVIERAAVRQTATAALGERMTEADHAERQAWGDVLDAKVEAQLADAAAATKAGLGLRPSPSALARHRASRAREYTARLKGLSPAEQARELRRQFPNAGSGRRVSSEEDAAYALAMDETSCAFEADLDRANQETPPMSGSVGRRERDYMGRMPSHPDYWPPTPKAEP